MTHVPVCLLDYTYVMLALQQSHNCEQTVCSTSQGVWMTKERCVTMSRGV